ncbi:MAG: cell division protein FtsA [Candidatus Gracilibacteria bacterium]
MAKDNTIVGLDIGTSKIRTVIATIDAREMLPNVVGAGVSPSSGLRKGAIVDVNETIAAITASLEDAERMSGQPIHHAVIAVGGSHLAAQNSRGVIAVPHGGEITVSDVERVLEAAQAVNIQPNRQILHVVPKSYTVDDQHDIRNPLGMTGVRLEVEAHIITGLTPALKNLENAVHQSGVDVDDFVPASLAAAEAVLSKRQKELGVVSIDIGASSTSIAVYEEGAILGTFVLPIGGDAVSNDVAIGLKTSVDTAEKLKIEYGSCNPVEISERETVDLSAISKTDSQVIERKTLAEIIQARYHEIFTMVNEKLATLQRDGQLPAGAVLTGGAAKIPEVIGLAREVLSLPVQIGFPTDIDGVVDRIDDPAYATAIGLILFGAKGPTRSYGVGNVDFSKAFGNVKHFFKKLLPGKSTNQKLSR